MVESTAPRRIDPVSYTATWLDSCARSVARRMVRRLHRTQDKVMQEYDAGRWSDILSSKDWSGSAHLARYLAGEQTRRIVAYVDGEVCEIATNDYYSRRIASLANLLADFIDPNGEVIELGCGYGYNLLSLANAWQRAILKGFDVSPNGIKAANELAAHFELADRISVDIMDVTNASDPNFPQVRGRPVFTYFCIEQIPYQVTKVVENILAHRPSRVVHVEPGTGLLNWWKPRDWPEYLYLHSVDYQDELYAVLRRFEQRGKLRILRAMRTPFAPSIQNRGLVVAWEPVVTA